MIFMKNSRNIILLFLFIAAASGSCIDPYEPAVLAEDLNFLVVEGFLNSGKEPSIIKLSRTVRLNDNLDMESEQNATVTIESEKGAIYELQSAFDGSYVLQPQDLDAQDRYRLRIKSNSDGKEYLSEYTELKETPPIDSVNWKYNEDGVRIFVNTHDPQNNSLYYRWEYEEAWEYNVPHRSYVKFENGKIIDREVPTPVECWKENSSANIILGSSAKLQKDIISQRLLTFIPKGERRLSSRYSILVKQYAMTKEAFSYYGQMEKNSEQRGSFFDPQPMELNGNIKCLNFPEETVIGFFSVGSVQKKRIFIDKRDVVKPDWFFREDCSQIEVKPEEFSTYLSGSYDPVYIDMTGNAIAAPTNCVDCSKYASPVKPPFWE